MCDRLNPEQLAAVGSTAKTIPVVIAGAGTGKSRTLVARIRWQLARGTDPKKLAAFTFTNKGANVIAQRLAPTKLAYVGTIHGFCMRLIQNHGYLLGYRMTGVSIVTQETQLRLLKASREKLGRKISDKEMLARETEGRETHLGGLRVFGQTLEDMIDYSDDRILVDGLAILKMGVPENGDARRAASLDELQDSGAIRLADHRSDPG